jgi:PAP2 superfamily C-terminal
MEVALRHYQALMSNAAFLRSITQGAAFLAASMIAIFAAVSYATVNASNHVTDLVLSNIDPVNVRFLFVYGTFFQLVVFTGLILWRPNRLPFALKSIALFLLIRAVFISLTHIAPYPIDPEKPAPLFNSIFYGGDLFFSGHTGLPFLAAMAFWHMPSLRIYYLASTLFFGTVVLLGHYHYSIDVLAALFITHGIFQLARWLFRRDYILFRSSEEQRERKPKGVVRRQLDKWSVGRNKAPMLVTMATGGSQLSSALDQAATDDPAPSRSNVTRLR